jgi:hypothetical protein
MRWAVLVLISGCSSILGIEDFTLAEDASPSEYCLGPMGWQVCLPAAPTNPVTFTTSTFDTSTGTCLATQPESWRSAGQPDACFVVASTISITSPLSISGTRPIVLVADSISISNKVDVASHANGSNAGPGSPDLACKPAVTQAMNGGGGAGGSFSTSGGNGGASSYSTEPGVAAPKDPEFPTKLRAGCSGAFGRGSNAQNSGAPGRGGGAIYLLAGTRILFDGAVDASGAAGGGGGSMAGGGGGGSGGMIVLVSPTVGGFGGYLMANGGGGGGGGGVGAGDRGSEPENPIVVAEGGVGANGGGRGGDGFAGTRNAMAGGSGAGNFVGGGGGGGASGYITVKTNAPLPSTILTSPAIRAL